MKTRIIIILIKQIYLLTKIALQIVKRMKLISSKMRFNNTTNQKCTKNGSNGHFVKYQTKFKDTPTFTFVLCERYNFLSKSILIDERIVNKIINFL